MWMRDISHWCNLESQDINAIEKEEVNIERSNFEAQDINLIERHNALM